ncbi:MAG: hypothetical protein WB995_11335, partial [Candidatus Acidiferrales bacterium]
TPPSVGFTGSQGGPVGLSCGALTSKSLSFFQSISANGATYRAISQVAPGSTPFAFQAGAKFIF